MKPGGQKGARHARARPTGPGAPSQPEGAAARPSFHSHDAARADPFPLGRGPKAGQPARSSRWGWEWPRAQARAGDRLQGDGRGGGRSGWRGDRMTACGAQMLLCLLVLAALPSDWLLPVVIAQEDTQDPTDAPVPEATVADDSGPTSAPGNPGPGLSGNWEPCAAALVHPKAKNKDEIHAIPLIRNNQIYIKDLLALKK
uniref:Uncharacterized protein n=1 Tax=Sphaerodactylus townsendi TaxID=933632 RepID=A0ACB8ETU5_9SAUR